jgi:hypothetical protein
MISTLAVIALALAVASPRADARGVGVVLRYDRPLGQVTEYRLSLDARGEQVSLGERIPVRWHAEVVLREEVIARSAGGEHWLRVGGRMVEITDATGALAGGLMERWPEAQLRVTARGEVLDASAAVGEEVDDARHKAFFALLGHPTSVVLPPGRAQVGDCWEWEADGARQSNCLASLGRENGDLLATIASEARLPIETQQSIDALGLKTHLTGEVEQTSVLKLPVAGGPVTRHTGQMRIHSTSRVRLALPGGEEQFEMTSDLTVDFDLRPLPPGAAAARDG